MRRTPEQQRLHAQVNFYKLMRVEREHQQRSGPTRRAAKHPTVGRTDLKSGRMLDMKFHPLRRNAEWI